MWHALIWLIAGILLAAAEALSGDFFLIMLAGGALVTAGCQRGHRLAGLGRRASSSPSPRISLLMLVRPVLLRRFATPPPTPTNVDALTGKHALVLEQVAEHAGQVKLGGEVWTARPLDTTEVYPPGTTVTVMKIDGATAVVWKGP